MPEVCEKHQPEVAAVLPAASRASDCPIIQIFTCALCHRRFYGQPLVLPSCPACDHGLHSAGPWDLRSSAWPWLQGGGV